VGFGAAHRRIYDGIKVAGGALGPRSEKSAGEMPPRGAAKRGDRAGGRGGGMNRSGRIQQHVRVVKDGRHPCVRGASG